MILLWILSLLARVRREAPAPAHRVEQCLLQFLFYHEDSASCWDALDFGPCPEGEWLVPGQEAGVVAHLAQLDAHVAERGQLRARAARERGEQRGVAVEQRAVPVRGRSKVRGVARSGGAGRGQRRGTFASVRRIDART